ncbi:MAG: DUF72 domain-containing protein [Pegethrix bostrychoides GSE-TBD4-15B]|jgi:uncharacterized protein YecE (DUF72 family)|uniref:DUF72 domain-containing protein n=1 Tax=Pegethrix bostrychoides GSE-TBD4-15B TaxID=2839662 RepID=A0A951U6F1_9CYAN|nr:DUF72 domain-containing protein [Pegethrix bostrychoides GSE-TBD4-15B]
MSFRLGCAIWAYKDWVGDLFPKGSRPADFLQLYSRRFMTVEGNTTFYSVPDAATVQRWASQTPAGFQFCPKLPRQITHQGRLVPQLPALLSFVERMQGLGNRLGVLFAQLPPSYSPAELADLQAFLRAWTTEVPTEAKLAVELRHPGWFELEQANHLNALLADFGVGRVLLDTRPIYECPDDPQLTSERRKPRLPLQPVTTAAFSIVRYISHPELAYNQTYLEFWAMQVQQWLQQNQQVYFFVHCPVEQHSPHIARHFQQLLELVEPDLVPPLPWNLIESAVLPVARQLDLF